MGQKKTPGLVSAAKKLRAAGRSNREIAEELTRKGVSVSEATVRNWLGSAEGVSKTPPPGDAAPPPVAPAVADDPEASEEASPEELASWLTKQIRLQRTIAARLRADGKDAEAQRETRLGAQLVGLLQKQRARQEDGDAVRVRPEEVREAADRAMRALHTLADRVLAERALLPRCEVCGQPTGELSAGDKSPIRALVERLFGRVP